jgi:hypothetical protein
VGFNIQKGKIAVTMEKELCFIAVPSFFRGIILILILGSIDLPNL